MWKVGIAVPAAAFFGAVAILGPVPGGQAFAGANVIKVIPTGDPLQDIPNIQDAVAAVDEGGTVLLRARDAQGALRAFNFGQDFRDTLDEARTERELNSVNIRKSVRIRGESLDDDDDDGEDLDDEARTTLEGGFEPFRVLAPGIDVVIEGIDFTCTRYKAIQVTAGERVVIKNNRFRKVTFFQDDPLTFAIAVASDTGQEVISVGSVEIAGNVIDPNPDPSPPCPLPDTDPDPSREELGTKVTFGFLGSNVDGEIIIRGNLIRNTARIGVGFLDALGSVKVRDNVIEPGPLAVSQPRGNFGINVLIGFFEPSDRAGGRFVIKRNRVTCTHRDCRGIAVEDTSLPREGRAVVKHNHIDMAIPENETPDLPFAAGLDVLMSNSVLSSNTIEGRSNFAVLLEGNLGGGLDNLANNNRIVRNRVRGFTPLSTNYFGLALPEPVHYALFDANDNRLRGKIGKVCLGGFVGSSGNVVAGGLDVIAGENCQ